jgi:uncharacterized protein (TIGR02284 family)
MPYIYSVFSPPETRIMINESAAQVLNDLIQVNNERINRYETLIAALPATDQELRFLFAKIIGESHQNKIILATELQAMGETIELAPDKRGKVYEASVSDLYKAKHVQNNRLNVLDHSDACEGAVLKAYNFSLMSHDVAAYLRDLLYEHQQRITDFRSEIKILRDQTA